jgi:uncharacterized RDD family membrane protein YckC
MELMQGTLADRLVATGPLSPGAAVDVTLQLIEGLQAAEEAGILHRDVKPSNCFVDADSVVKIGDFGISRSLRPNEETVLSMRGQLTGTPTYAPPEQLRGATVDVRADIYSLGATLYELVTGRRPFIAQDLMALLMAVANDVPEAPHRVAPAVPPGLGHVILRCLAKRPEDRFANYAAMARALAPYQSLSPTPATLGRRFLAGVVDHAMMAVVMMPTTMLIFRPQLPTVDVKLLVVSNAVTVTFAVLYYGASESVWRRTPGKAMLGLTVVDTGGRPARALACWGRAGLYVLGSLLSALAIYAVWSPRTGDIPSGSPWVGVLGTAVQFGVLGILFSTVRRRNGYAALHDLVTGTRVVEQRPAVVAEPRAERHEPTRALAPTAEIRGAFAVLQGEVPGRGGWRPGVDDRLRRPVWIRDVPPGTAAVSPARVSLSRPTRLRWLAGRRVGPDAWDVYEGIAGVPLTRACASPTSWADARGWLLDLTQELAAQGARDRPPLSLDRVWVLDRGRAKLLDDPALDAPRSPGEAEALALLRDATRTIRSASRGPWPIGAERVGQALAAGTGRSLAELAGDLDALGRRPATVSRGRRLLTIAPLLMNPVIITLVMSLTVALFAAAMANQPVDDRVAAGALIELRNASRDRLSPADRDRIETMLATRYRAQLSDPSLFDPRRFLLVGPEHRAIADRILRRPASATAAAEPPPRVMQQVMASASKPRTMPPAGVLAILVFTGMYVVAGLVALLIAPIARGGLMLRLLGLELVTADGRRASRLRVLWRAAVAWTPAWLPIAAQAAIGNEMRRMVWFCVVCLVLAAAGAIVAVLRPSRGLQDRLAGTWIVPR